MMNDEKPVRVVSKRTPNKGRPKGPKRGVRKTPNPDLYVARSEKPLSLADIALAPYAQKLNLKSFRQRKKWRRACVSMAKASSWGFVETAIQHICAKNWVNTPQDRAAQRYVCQHYGMIHASIPRNHPLGGPDGTA